MKAINDKKLLPGILLPVLVSVSVFLFAGCSAVDNSYTVRFNANGAASGTAPGDMQATAGSVIQLPGGTLVRPGFTFGGWNTNADGSGVNFAARASFIVTGDTTLFARWIQRTGTTHTVTFNANGATGGTAPSSMSATPGSTIQLPNQGTLVRPGFTFGGWNTAANGAGTNFAAGASFTVNRNVTLFARWIQGTAPIHTVTFNANGATGGTAPGNVQATAGSSITLPNQGTLVRPGFTFGGWNTAANGSGDNFAAGTSFTVTGNITLFARWEQSSRLTINNLPTASGDDWYAVYVFASGTDLSTVQAVENVFFNARYFALGAVVPDGISDNIFTMTGWSGVAPIGLWEGSGTFPVLLVNIGGSPTSGVNPMYRWATITFVNGSATVNFSSFATVARLTVRFNSNGGNSIANRIVNYGSAVSRPADPTRSGHTFDRWHSDADLTVEYNFSTPITRNNTTLFAAWTTTVTFNSNGGGAVPAQTFRSGGRATRPEDPTRSGHVFMGWYRNANFTTAHDFSSVITGHITLFARWSADRHTVRFNSNGGSEVPSQIVMLGETAIRPEDPTRKYYVFDNWYRNANLTIVHDFSTPVTANITLFAGWHINYRTVSFNSNGGSSVPNQRIIIGETANRPEDPVFDSLDFVNWYTNANFTTPYDFTTPVTRNITLFARWINRELTRNLGDVGPGGGIIFYRSELGFIMIDTGETYHYLEAPPSPSRYLTGWASSSFNADTWDIPTMAAIGTGRQNTANIIARDGIPNRWNAALLARSFVNSDNDKTDWFLPSQEEARQLSIAVRNNLLEDVMGGRIFWTSTQNTRHSAWRINLDHDWVMSAGKRNVYGVWPIRAVSGY